MAAWNLFGTSLNFSGILISSIILVVAGGLGYLMWHFFMKPHRLTWPAIVYMKSEAKLKTEYVDQSTSKDAVINDLNRLVPFYKDKVVYDGEKFFLAKLGYVLPGVEIDAINDWRHFHHKLGRFLEVLKDQDSCTLMKSGYDANIGMKIYRPMPFANSVSLMGNLELRLRRRMEKQSLLQQIFTWILIVVLIIAIISMGVINGNTLESISKDMIKQKELDTKCYGVLAEGNMLPAAQGVPG
jgi:hypothetical protein